MATTPQVDAPIFNTINVAAQRLGVGRSFLYEEIRAGRLRLVKFGRRSTIPEADLQRYAAEKMAEAA